MRSGLIVVGVCLCISIGMGIYLKGAFSTELVATQDLVTGLIYYLEDHNGRFPPSEEAFLAQPYVEPVPDGNGAIRIRPKPGTRYRDETHGYVIEDLAPFEVQWGADLTGMEMDDRGVVRDADGKRVELVCWPSSPPSGKTYSAVLLGISRAIREYESERTRVADSPKGVVSPAEPAGP